MEQAFTEHRKALESLYDGLMTVYVTTTQTNPDTHVEEEIVKAMYTDIPCRVSYRNLTVELNDMTASANREVDVFVSPEITIPEGSRMSILWQGKTLELKRTGIPAVHLTHNQYSAEIIKEYL